MKINPIKPDKLTPLSLGDKVIIIDFDEDPTECAIFTISDLKNNLFALTTLDNHSTYEPLWVEPQDVRQINSVPFSTDIPQKKP